MRRDGRVAYEGRLFARVEEAQTHIMVRGICREHECHLGMRELTRDGEQRGITLPVRVEHDGRRIAGKARGCKCVNLKDPQGSLRCLGGDFCTHRRSRLHFLMRAAVEISMYPLTVGYRVAIQAFIDRLNTHPGLVVLTNALATQIWGELDAVMAVLTEEMTRSAADAPQLVFVMKVLPGLA